MRYERVAMLAVVGTLAVWAVTCKTGDGPPPPVGGPPSVDAGVDMHTVPGHAAGFPARITIPDGASASNYKWTMSWGDGSADSGTVAPTGMINAAHSYANVGSYVARLAGQGPDPADTAADTITVHVDDASAPVRRCGSRVDSPIGLDKPNRAFERFTGNRRKVCSSFLIATVNHTSVRQPAPIVHP